MQIICFFNLVVFKLQFVKTRRKGKKFQVFSIFDKIVVNAFYGVCAKSITHYYALVSKGQGKGSLSALTTPLKSVLCCFPKVYYQHMQHSYLLILLNAFVLLSPGCVRVNYSIYLYITEFQQTQGIKQLDRGLFEKHFISCLFR